MAGGKKRIEKGLPTVVNMGALLLIYAVLVFGLVGGDGLYETISQIVLCLLVGIHFLEFFDRKSESTNPSFLLGIFDSGKARSLSTLSLDSLSLHLFVASATL